MPDVFIGLKEAAAFEGISYDTIKKRVQRNPQQYKTKMQPSEAGGREQVLVSVDSLTAKGRKAWRAAQKIDGRDVVIEKRTESAPWYVGVDLNHYTEQHKKAFYEAVELAARVQDFIDYDGPDRTAYAERYALGLGVSLPTLYRYVDNILKANAWALKMEKEDGQSRDYFRALSLCRKPKATATFPSLTDEQKALIQNIWFDRRFAANLGTIEMLYEKFEEVAEGRGWENYPSIKTVARYIKHLMDSRGGESARYLAANGSREWKNKKMLKGKRDATSTPSTFGFSGSPRTGRSRPSARSSSHGWTCGAGRSWATWLVWTPTTRPSRRASSRCSTPTRAASPTSSMSTTARTTRRRP